MHRLAKLGVPFQDDAQDFFIVHRGGFPWNAIPDFVIGRPAYDNWLVDYAFHHDFDTVDVTKSLHAVHQTGVDGNKAGHVVNVARLYSPHSRFSMDHISSFNFEISRHCIKGD